jgi:hypothetical protein
MNEVAAIAPVITAGNAALRREFPLKPTTKSSAR